MSTTAVQQPASTRSTTCCFICHHEYTATGPHMPAQLPECGHMGGKRCLEEAVRRYSRCPICSRKAAVSEVRQLVGELVGPND